MTNMEWDTIVVGAGNAAMSAALSALEHGSRVVVLERAPRSERGGNTYFTGGLYRFPFKGIDDIREIVDLTEDEANSTITGQYTEEDFFNDIGRVTQYQSDTELAHCLVTNAFPTLKWLRQQGVRFVMTEAHKNEEGKRRVEGNLVVEAVGGGADLSDSYFDLAEKKGIEVWYDSRAVKLLTDDHGAITGVRIRRGKEFLNLSAPSVVLACGGFESSPEMRARYLGTNWDLARVRGTSHNHGDGLTMAFEVGAMPYGNWSNCHSVQWDANSPPFGVRKYADTFHKHQYIYSIMVNKLGQRFVDEGEEHYRYTYAKMGRAVLNQPNRIAYQIFDQKVVGLLRRPYQVPHITKVTAQTLEDLAEQLEIPSSALIETVKTFNAAVQEGNFNPSVTDGKCTRGITPPKSNWALPIDTPPFVAFPVTCGITFTFGGLRVNTNAEVISHDGSPIQGLFAAGELVGGLWYHNYPSGSGLMSGAVFGRIAGRNAAGHAKALKLGA